MAYNKATVTKIDPPDTEVGRIRVTVTFTGNAGEPAIDQSYWLDGSQTSAQLQAQVANKAAALNTVVTTRAAISVGQVVSIVPPVVTPSQADIDKNKYFTLLSTWNKVQEDIQNGCIVSSDPKVTQLETDLKAAYKPEYSGL